ncbi:hypothetical protein ACLOJK_039179 [Asimina triloba]
MASDHHGQPKAAPGPDLAVVDQQIRDPASHERRPLRSQASYNPACAAESSNSVVGHDQDHNINLQLAAPNHPGLHQMARTAAGSWSISKVEDLRKHQADAP